VTVGSQVLFDSGAAPDLVTIYDAAAGTWSTAKLSQPRDGRSIAGMAGCSGCGGSPLPPVVDIYDSAGGQ
jgi:hypothetical protein